MENLKIVINEQYSQYSDFIRQIEERFDSEGTLIRKERNTLKYFTMNDGLIINVKRFAVPHFINQIFYSYFRKTKAERSYTYAVLLLEKRIQTPEPIAYIEQRKNGLLGYSYLFTKHVDFPHDMYQFEEGVNGQTQIVQDFAAFAARVHANNILHKDFSPGNILFKTDENGVTQFLLVDINRFYFGKVGLEMGCRNFQRLWGDKEFFRLLSYTYATERGYDKERCFEIIYKSAQQFWKKFHFYRYKKMGLDEPF